MDNITLSTNEVLAYPEDIMQVAHAAYSADINFATILPFDLTAKFNKATPCRSKMLPSVR